MRNKGHQAHCDFKSNIQEGPQQNKTQNPPNSSKKNWQNGILLFWSNTILTKDYRR